MRAPQMQTPGGGLASADTKSTNTTIIGDDLAADKHFKTLQAQFALKGHTLCRTDASDGPVSLFVGKWGMVRYLPTLDAAESFLRQIGGAV